jgi:hypothetical protein
MSPDPITTLARAHELHHRWEVSTPGDQCVACVALEQVRTLVEAARHWQNTEPPGIGPEELRDFLRETPAQHAAAMKDHLEAETALRLALEAFGDRTENE